MILKKYTPQYCTTLAELFYNTVHNINRKDYTQIQCNAWASKTVDLEQWNTSFLKQYCIVAEINGVIVGFGDIDKTGYLDKLFVHHNYQHKGIASAICDVLEKAVNVTDITVHASITARGFFEKRGYKIIKSQQVKRHGVFLKNYVMTKTKINPL